MKINTSNRDWTITDPYSSTIGVTIPVANTRAELKKYISTTKERNLNYEYVNTPFPIVVITGLVDEETAIPFFDHVIIVENTITNTPTVCVDVRKCVKSGTNTRPTKVNSIIKQMSDIDFIMLRALLTADFLNDSFGVVTPILDASAAAYGMYYNNAVTKGLFTITAEEKIKMTAALLYSFYSLAMPSVEFDVDYQNEVMARVRKSKTGELLKKDIGTMMLGFRPTTSKLTDILYNVSHTLPDEKKSFVTSELFVSKLVNSWYGPGGDITTVIAVENPITWIAMVYIAIKYKNFQKYGMPSVIHNIENTVNKDSRFLKYVDNYVAGHIM